MQVKTAFIVTILLCIVLAIAGCTSTQAPTATPTQVPVSVATPASGPASGDNLVPSPTDVVIDSRKVTFNVEKDHIGNVIVTFQGGSGLIHVKKIDVTLNRADGQVKTASMGIKIDDSSTLEGTKQTDRVMVYVTMDDGKMFKVRDEMIAYRTR